MVRPKSDPGAPSQSATILQIVRNRNNLEDLLLRRRVEEYQKTLATNLCDLEQERLDVFDFIKQLKSCESEILEEYKLINEKLHHSPPSETGSDDTTPPILPLITMNTAASGQIPRRNGAFSIDVQAIETAPASMLWKDPNFISLKDISIKSIRTMDKKASMQQIPEKCLRKLAAAGWVDVFQCPDNGKIRKHKNSKGETSPTDEHVRDGDTANVSGKIQNQPKENKPPSRQPLPTSFAKLEPAPPSRGYPVVRTSTAEKPKHEEQKTTKAIKKMSSSSPELHTIDSESTVGLPLILAPNGSKVNISEKLMDALTTQKKLSKLELQRETTEILKTIVERKAAKYVAKRKQRTPLEKRLNEFYKRVDLSSVGRSLETFLPVIDKSHPYLVRTNTHFY